MYFTDVYTTPLTVLCLTRLSLFQLSPLWFGPSLPPPGLLHQLCLSVLPTNCFCQFQELLRNSHQLPGAVTANSSARLPPILLPTFFHCSGSTQSSLPPCSHLCTWYSPPQGMSPLPHPNPNQQLRPDLSYLAVVTSSPRYLIHTYISHSKLSIYSSFYVL